MKVAICGYPPLALKYADNLKNIGVEYTHFIIDFISARGETEFQIHPPVQPVNFFNFRKLIENKQIDGVIIFEYILSDFTKNVIKLLKLYNIPNVGVIGFGNPYADVYWLDGDKAYIPYMETNLIDSCNLNCKACTHYANLFSDEEFYKLEDFKRDIRNVAENVDIIVFRLLGGEPLKLKNINEYIKISRKFLPNTYIRLVTNGLLVPNMPQDFFQTLRENNCVLDISQYIPTIRMLEKIESVLQNNNVKYQFCTGKIEKFNVFLSLQGGHNPLKSRAVCYNDDCRFLRNGKIYKCPVDALSFKFVEHFGIKDFPAATGVDIFAKNFSALIEQLNGNIELCSWCSETARQIQWTPENNPKLTDWLANPAEAENFLPK